MKYERLTGISLLRPWSTKVLIHQTIPNISRFAFKSASLRAPSTVAGGGFMFQGLPRRVLLLVLLATVLVLHCCPAYGQVGTNSTLQGTVLDRSGATMPDATVTVRNVSLGLERTTKVDAQGHYIFAALPPTGEYQVTAESPGFAPEIFQGLTFQANTSNVVNFTLKPGTVQERVVVSEQAPLVESTQSQVAHTVDDQEVQELPVVSRNFFDYMNLTPGVVRTGSGSGNVTLNGQGIRQLTILADGVTNQLREIRTLGGDLAGANGTFSLDVVKEMQVITNAYSAEFGRSLSGVVNVITKSGTNQFHGDGFIYGRPASLAATDPLTKRDPDLNREQWGVTIGGPIVKDKTHFLGNYEQTHQNQLDTSITSPLEPHPGVILNQPFKELKTFGKVDHQFSTNERLEGRYSFVRSRTDNINVGGLNTSDRADAVDDFTQNVEASLTSLISSRMVNEFRFAFTKDKFDNFQEAVGPNLPPDYSHLTAAINRAGVGNLGPDPNLPQNLNEKGIHFIDKLSHTIGRHNLKYGGDVSAYFRFVTFYNNLLGMYNFIAGTPFPFNPSNPKTFPVNYQQAFGKSGLNFHEQLLGLFFQDDFNVKRGLTLNMGLRYDYETLMRDTNNFAPRFGFAWDPKNNGKTVIRGSYGIFFSTVETSLINRESNSGPQGLFTISITPFNADGSPNPVFPTFPNRLTALPTGVNFVRTDVFIPITRGLSSTDFPESVGNKFGGLRVNPYAQQLNFGIQRELVPNLALAIDYVMVHGLKLLRTEDLNAPPLFEVFPGHTRTVAQADALRPFGVPSRVPGPLGVGFGGFRNMFVQESGDASIYHAMNVRLTKRFSRHFTMDGFYTFSKAISDSDNFRVSSSRHLDPTNYRLDRGLADQDRRHNFVLSGIWELPLGFRVGGIFNAVSGIRYSGVTGGDPMGLGDSQGGTTRERPGALGRNTFGGRRLVNMDANVAKEIKLTERQRLELRAEVFNLANHFNTTMINNAIGLDPTRPPATFGLPTSTNPGRQFQFAGRYSF
jgi:outer membrane receptor for ferrienterochelin and colicin